MPAAPQEISKQTETGCPGSSACDVVEQEAPVGHARNVCDQRHQRTRKAHEPPQEHGGGHPTLKKALGTGQAGVR